MRNALKTAFRIVWLLALAVSAAAAPTWAAGPVELNNQAISLTIATTGVSRLAEVKNLKTGGVLIHNEDVPLWELLWSGSNGDVRLTPDPAHPPTMRRYAGGDGETTELTWTAPTVGAGTATVTATVSLPDGSAMSHWRIKVTWTDHSLRLWQINYPRVAGIQSFSANDILTMPEYWGRMVVNPITSLPRFELTYPSPGSMQFWSYSGGGQGLYLATYDSDGWWKRWLWTADAKTRGGEWQATHYPPSPTAVPGSFAVPYDVVVGVFQGSWSNAARLYRSWALHQPWCREGPIQTRQSIPDWFKNVALWLKYYGAPGKVLSELWDHTQFLRVPTAVHYYRYPVSKFDDNYPEMLPAKPGFLDGVRDMQRLGAHVMPYTNGSIWDMDTESWQREGGAAAAAKTESGDFYKWSISDNTFAWMCPAAAGWQQKVRDFAGKLILDYGVDGVYLDVLSAGSARPCYDPSHGHPLHGGDYWGQGNRRLLDDLRTAIRKEKPGAVFTTEEICELYIDKLDGFLTLDVTRGGYRPPVMLCPLFTAVYHDYAIQYGSDCALSANTDTFCALLAEHFVYGAKPTLSEAAPPPIGDKLDSASYLREVTQCYDRVAKPFLLEGEWLPAPQLTTETRSVQITSNFHLTMPVVRQSMWRAPNGDIGWLLTNWSGEPQHLELETRLADYGRDGPWYARTAWPVGQGESRRCSGTAHFTVDLPPRGVRLLTLSEKPGNEHPSATPPRAPYIVLRRGADGRFPAAQVRPGTIWYGDGALVEIDARGALTVTTTQSGDDFVLLRRHEMHLEPPVPITVTDLSGDSVILTAAPRQTVKLAGWRGYLVVPRIGTVEAAAQMKDDLLTVPAAVAAPLHIWISPSIAGVPSTKETVTRRGSPEPALARELAARSQRAAEQLKSLAGGMDQPAAWQPAVSEAETITGAVETLTGVRINLVVPRAARVLPYEPLPVRLELLSDFAKPVQWKGVQTGIAVRKLRNAITLSPGTERKTGTLDTGGARAVIAEYRLLVTKRDLAEHTVSVWADVGVIVGGVTFQLTATVTLPIDMPLLAAPVERQKPLVAGRTATVPFRVQNVAPQPLTVTAVGTPPPGWIVGPSGGATVTVPAASASPGETTLTLNATAPRDARPGRTEIPFAITYNGHQETAVENRVAFDVLPALQPLRAGVTAAQPSAHLPRIRTRGRAILFLKSGESTAVKIQNIRVTTYRDRTAYTILDPDLHEIAKGTVDVNQSVTVPIHATTTGDYFVVVVPQSGSCIVTSPATYLAYEASPSQPLAVIYQNLTLYFFVPKGAREFGITIRCGGITEPADVKLVTPDGSTALAVGGALIDRRFTVAVPAGASGRIWQLTVSPREDVSIELDGDVLPYLSDHPDRVLATATDRS